jgi:hypothetical protein
VYSHLQVLTSRSSICEDTVPPLPNAGVYSNGSAGIAADADARGGSVGKAGGSLFRCVSNFLRSGSRDNLHGASPASLTCVQKWCTCAGSPTSVQYRATSSTPDIHASSGGPVSSRIQSLAAQVCHAALQSLSSYRPATTRPPLAHVNACNCYLPLPLTDDSSTSPSGCRWLLATPCGPVCCSAVLHATNGYASHLLPHLTGPAGIVPMRGQVFALCAPWCRSLC